MIDRQKINKLQLRGFKSFSQGRGIDITFSDINVLLGANGSGKSNFVAFMETLSALNEGRFQNFVAKQGLEQLLHYGSKYTQRIEANLSLSSTLTDSIYNIELNKSGSELLISLSESLIYRNRKEFTLSEKSELLTKESLLLVNKFQKGIKVFDFQKEVIPECLRSSSNLKSGSILQKGDFNLAGCLWNMKNEETDYYNRIVSFIKEIMPQFDDFSLTSDTAGNLCFYWKDNKEDYLQSLSQLSDATLRFAFLACLLLQPDKKMPDIIVLDNPEVGLHPVAVHQMAEMLKEASRYSQIFISTQSPLLVDEFIPSQIIIVERNNEEASTIINRLNTKKLEDWLQEYSLSDLWNRNILGGRP